MNKGDDCLPKFFKVYLPDDSGDDLELPISFNCCLPNSLPKNVIVRSIYGKIWKMELRKCCGDDVERFVMVNGWKRIVKDEDLKGGEFLAFEFDGSRFFNFCIYGERTCKRLGGLVQAKEMEDESDGEDGRSSDDIIVLDDDGEDNVDQECSDEDIIVLDDDDADADEDEDDDDDDADDENDDDEDYGDDDESNEDIIVLDDDDDDQDNGDKEIPSEDIILLDDDDGGDDSVDDENERRRGVETERKEKGSSGVYIKSDDEDDKLYLDDDTNPFFIVNQNVRRKICTRIPLKVIDDYGLRFPEFVYLIDPLEKRCGKLTRKVEGQVIKGFESIIRRNQVKPSDKMICELVRQMNGLVCEIKVHVIRG